MWLIITISVITTVVGVTMAISISSQCKYKWVVVTGLICMVIDLCILFCCFHNVVLYSVIKEYGEIIFDKNLLISFVLGLIIYPAVKTISKHKK